MSGLTGADRGTFRHVNAEINSPGLQLSHKRDKTQTTADEMASDGDSLPAQAIRLVRKVATGKHVLSRAVPILLLLLDALLSVVIIKKVPCMCFEVSLTRK